MGRHRVVDAKIMALADAMRGPPEERNVFLTEYVQRVAQTMGAAVGLRPPAPHGPSLPDAIDVASSSIVRETDAACALAGLNDVQKETLIQMSRKGIEAFTKACGLAMVEEIRAGRTEPDWDTVLDRAGQILPVTISVEKAGLSVPVFEGNLPGMDLHPFM